MSEVQIQDIELRPKNTGLTLYEEEPQLGLFRDGNTGLQVLLPPQWVGCIKRIEDSYKKSTKLLPLKVWSTDQYHRITWKLVRNAGSRAPHQTY